MNRVPEDFPPEIEPFVAELNALIEHNEAQSEAARRHAGNLAHALKTPMAVLMNEALAHGPDLAGTVIPETGTMHRHVDHQERKTVVEEKGVAVRGGLGGGRVI